MTYSPVDRKFLYSKHETFTQIMEKVLLLLEGEEISLMEARKIANFILDSISEVKNSDQMSVFLSELKNKWSDFGDIHTVQALSSYKKNEDQVIKKLESFINSSSTN